MRQGRMMGMLGLFAALLGQGLRGNIDAALSSKNRTFGSGSHQRKYRKRRHIKLTAAQLKKRKAKKRIENKSRSTNAGIARKSRFSR